MTTVDNPLAVDGVLRFGSDVKVTSVQRAFGLLVGLSQDVYVPSGIALAARVPHALVLDGAEPTADTDGAGVRGLTIDLLQPARVQSVSSATSSLDTADIEEYCETAAHVARKCEPSRFKRLLPAAGEPSRADGELPAAVGAAHGRQLLC
jgi:hypothetical protein